MAEKRLITAALPYVNNIPHLGHIVGSHLPADVFARFCRSKGYDTLFIGGSDEHGTPAELAAEEVGVSLKEFCDMMSQKHKEIYEWFKISYDNFSRTSKPIHHEVTKEFFWNLWNNGYISEGEMEQLYSAEEDRFLADRYVIGTCPHCGYEEATGDQCDKCTRVLNPRELIEPRSKISNSKLELKTTRHLFLDLNKLESDLKEWIGNHEHFRSQVKSIAEGWIREGLERRCITRDIKNGIQVPLEGYENKVFYVWFDAPIGYISSTKEISERWESFWKDEGTKIFHYLGKDNIPFHTILWPAMLIGNGEYTLPHNVIGMQNLNFEGQKFSKSRKVGVFCEKLLESDLEPDVLRAYLARQIPETADSEFKWDEFMERVNDELVGNYGNFVNRGLSFLHKKFEGKIVRPEEDELTEQDHELLNESKRLKGEIEEALEYGSTRDAYMKFMELSTKGNQYIHSEEPWHTIKENPERVQKVLYLCANHARSLAIAGAPFMPDTSQKIWDILNLEGNPDDANRWDEIGHMNLGISHVINKPYLLFHKVEEEEVSRRREELSQLSDLKSWFA